MLRTRRTMLLAAAAITLLLLMSCARGGRAQRATPVPRASNVVSQAGPALPDACAVRSVRYLTEGGDQSWSPDGSTLIYDQLDASGISQLHAMSPDGSNDRCLTCDPVPGAPRTDHHKFNPNWRPTGDFLIVQGEMDTHPLVQFRQGKPSEYIANGLWSNLFAATADAQHWYRLTDYDSVKADGPLYPYFSPDGSQVLWSRLVERGTFGMGAHPFGRWRLQLADFVVDDAGTPSLQNVRDITPDGATFVEPSGFSPDGSKVLFTGDLENTNAWGMDIWTLDLTTGALADLTRGAYWEEHAAYAPSGRLISFMSSSPYPTMPFKTELFLMNADGTSKRQITNFNVDGAAEKTAEKSMPIHNSWSPDGTNLAITLQYGGASYPKRQLYMLTFAGPCGA
jgi:hypothetical protein